MREIAVAVVHVNRGIPGGVYFFRHQPALVILIKRNLCLVYFMAVVDPVQRGLYEPVHGVVLKIAVMPQRVDCFDDIPVGVVFVARHVAVFVGSGGNAAQRVVGKTVRVTQRVSDSQRSAKRVICVARGLAVFVRFCYQPPKNVIFVGVNPAQSVGNCTYLARRRVLIGRHGPQRVSHSQNPVKGVVSEGRGVAQRVGHFRHVAVIIVFVGRNRALGVGEAGDATVRVINCRTRETAFVDKRDNPVQRVIGHAPAVAAPVRGLD